MYKKWSCIDRNNCPSNYTAGHSGEQKNEKKTKQLIPDSINGSNYFNKEFNKKAKEEQPASVMDKLHVMREEIKGGKVQLSTALSVGSANESTMKVFY